ncbi:MAG: recJ [Alphaproteobacteria bacterium]|nr:recJ [Alphaproteobacteria bacterium]
MQSALLEKEEVISSLTSMTGRKWRVRNYDDRFVQMLKQDHGVEPLVAQILAARGIPAGKIAGYLNPKLRAFLPDPFSFKDMDKAVARLALAIQNKEKIALFGDYDVDGATSTALMARFLRYFGLEPTIHIPDRLLEGYGPNIPAFQKLIDDKHTLIITLDCGVVAFEPLKFAAANNTDVLVIDHHMASPELPPAVAIVNPNRLDETAGHGYMAAVGVTFMTLVAACQELRKGDMATPDLLEWLDLVALGTICDVVPLVDLNRAFAAQGLKIMGQRKNHGIKALADVIGMDQMPNAYHAGFMIGPRINAGGRIASSSLGVHLLCSACEHETLKIAQELDQHNRDRQTIEKQSVEEAHGMVLRQMEKFSHMIVLSSRDWHPGVIGLIAARMKEQYQRPTCIIALDGKGKGKASGRSINGIDLGALVIKARLESIIHEGGGHAMAAGFSIAEDNIETLHDFFQSELLREFGPSLPPQEIMIDGIITPYAVQLPVVKQLQLLEPFGQGNPSPRLLLSPVRLHRVDIVKEKHLRLTISDLSGQQRLSVMLFSQANTALHQELCRISPQQKIAVLGSLKLNAWQGREEAQFIADDIALLGGN